MYCYTPLGVYTELPRDIPRELPRGWGRGDGNPFEGAVEGKGRTPSYQGRGDPLAGRELGFPCGDDSAWAVYSQAMTPSWRE